MGTVPEGLLVTLTVSLALSAKNMYAKNVLVKVSPCAQPVSRSDVPDLWRLREMRGRRWVGGWVGG